MPVHTDSGAIRAELSERAWEAIDSLVQTLGSTLDLREVVQRALLTVTGQLLVRRAAFYLLSEDRSRYELVDCVGIRRSRMGCEILRVDEDGPGDDVGVGLVDLPPLGPLAEQFERAVPISDGASSLGLLVLGERLGRRDRQVEDDRLLRTMGMVIGTSVRRTLAYQNLAESNRQMGHIHKMQQQILDHVSHEFRTPLTVLTTASAILSADPEEEDRNDCLQMQKEALVRLEALVDDVLRVARGDRESGVLELVSHGDLVESLLRPIGPSTPWRDGGLRLVLRVEPLARLRLDRDALQDALRRLLDNAWAFSERRRRHALLASYVLPRSSWDGWKHEERIVRFDRWVCELGWDESPPTPFCEAELPEAGGGEGDVLVIELLDLGVGIPGAELELIFEPFAQASNSPQYGVRGVGMGLATARDQVVAMGGELTVHSVVGSGSIFSIVLPIVDDGDAELAD